jgi:thioredoxin-related protein
MKNTVISILSVILIFSCGSTKEMVDDKVEQTAEVMTGNEEMGQVKISTTTEANEIAEGVGKEVIDNTKINWLDFETAIDKNEKNKKFIFIDIYTDWCGWCKKMDASTFMDKEVVKYMNTNFYAVKMNAESKEPIAYKGQLYEYKQYNAKAGYNTLAVGLLDAKMSFPSFVVLNKNEVKKGKIAGFKDATTLLTLLKGYVGK